MFKTILCAIDGSAATERLLLYALHFGRTEHAMLHVLHAYQLPAHYAAHEGYEDLIAVYRQVAQNVIADARRYLEETGVEAAGEAVEGAPAELILREAERVGADLILLGHRNPNDVADMLLGSVSQQVLNAARLPVLIVP